ncbi:MAG TPA: hypothetical protein VGU61_20965 [Noviherbaspirillum sp.]|jgi:hypothetical protein|uniref:hypothetical protein n=1 Tax=Noviherbaspirillum sp. TaxID=1926288 RepID=UPI002DDC918E|nr:hypothetical protein [Noviherbaspirillum sp.]HEV2612745.1 hypothetical protein [Noviherbaspirillum sp.]
MTMTCADGATYQCTGSSIIRVDNGVALTSSGVQVYGRSTSDLRNPNPDTTTATGLALATGSGGLADIRIAKGADGRLTAQRLILSNLGLSWDGRTERPVTIETFDPTSGRSVLGANGVVSAAPLPPNTDLGFFDVATRGTAGTQANYANNRYFPRTAPPRCTSGGCQTIETSGLQFVVGDWRTGGGSPDLAFGMRLHSDGDIHAGDGVSGGTGPGVPFPGSKGYRQYSNEGLQYGNLSTWFSQDTVQIVEWTGGPGALEHNKNRRGAVAFGAVTDPAVVPTTGTASYDGFVTGWYAANGANDPVPVRGQATITANFATRQVTVALRNVVNRDNNAALPFSFTTTVNMGAAGISVANYMTGALSSGGLTGGLSGRYFGPVVTGGAGAGPAEVAGAMSLSNAAGAALIGGFIAKKQ